MIKSVTFNNISEVDVSEQDQEVEQVHCSKGSFDKKSDKSNQIELDGEQVDCDKFASKEDLTMTQQTINTEIE
jgi:hypothetical protein